MREAHELVLEGMMTEEMVRETETRKKRKIRKPNMKKRHYNAIPH